MDAMERDAAARIDGASMLAQVTAWSRINSGTGNVDGLTRMAAALADAFAVLPGDLRLVAPDPVTSIAADGSERAVANGRHLRLSVRPHAPVRMLFTGHMDTVYGPDHPFQQVRDLGDGRVNGPGVADMKGGLAVMLAALTAVEADPLARRLGYDVVVNADEETGSLSSAALIADAARGKIAALTYEPALPDGTLAGARGGSANFAVVAKGVSAHAGRNPDDGRNAVLAAADLALRLARARAPDLSVNPARIDGGGPNNVVPDRAVLRVNFRPKTADAIARADRLMAEATATVARAHGVELSVHGGFSRPPKPIDAGAERLFALVKERGAALGLVLDRRDTGGVCDGNNIAAAGVPVVDTMGVRGGAIHSQDEYLIVDSLAERATLSALTILAIAERGRP